jgi:hypothetical protein
MNAPVHTLRRRTDRSCNRPRVDVGDASTPVGVNSNGTTHCRSRSIHRYAFSMSACGICRRNANDVTGPVTAV